MESAHLYGPIRKYRLEIKFFNVISSSSKWSKIKHLILLYKKYDFPNVKF